LNDVSVRGVNLMLAPLGSGAFNMPNMYIFLVVITWLAMTLGGGAELVPYGGARDL
jgi:hypothetical protein